MCAAQMICPGWHIHITQLLDIFSSLGAFLRLYFQVSALKSIPCLVSLVSVSSAFPWSLSLSLSLSLYQAHLQEQCAQHIIGFSFSQILLLRRVLVPCSPQMTCAAPCCVVTGLLETLAARELDLQGVDAG
jgi:hypothetical protein